LINVIGIEMNPINIPMLESKVVTKMKKLSKQSEFIEQGKVAPIHQDYPISNVGIILMVGKMGSGKTNDVLKFY
jgi:Tfp pilus assembly pilus retraction ATPase PilT